MLVLMAAGAALAAAAEKRQDVSAAVEARLAPRLAWIAKEKIRAGYNYCPPLEYYPLAKQCGLNAIIARIEIANDPSGDEGLRAKLKPGQPKPHVLEALDLLVASSRTAKSLGLRFFYMLNMGGSMRNVSDGFRQNPRRYNNGDTFSPMDDVYWTRVVEARFLRVAQMLTGAEHQIDGFMIDPEMYALQGRLPGDVDYGDFALGEFVKATDVSSRAQKLGHPGSVSNAARWPSETNWGAKPYGLPDESHSP